MDRYEKLEKLGEGAHGVVVKARVRSREEVLQDRRRGRQREEQQAAQADQAAVAEAAQEASALVEQSPARRKRKHSAEDAARTASAIAAAAAEDEELDAIEMPAPADTVVAIKKIRLRSAAEGLSMEAIREIKLLQELRHPNVLRLLDTFSHTSNIHLVLEYMVGDMEQLIRSMASLHKSLSAADVKAYMRMMLQGIEACHQNWIMHRDLKPGNLLIGTDGGIKIADFGLAKVYGSPDRRMSPQACTLWYRPPELLFGATAYGAAADMWSIGCIMGEMCWMKPMFAGPESEMLQLQRIFALLGTPSASDWPHVTQLASYIAFKPQAGHSIRSMFQALTDDAADLLAGLLQLNPAKRLTATEALAHRYFREKPLPTPMHQLPSLKAMQAQKEAAEQAAAQQARAGKASGKVLQF